jgi:hypothetical protein
MPPDQPSGRHRSSTASGTTSGRQDLYGPRERQAIRDVQPACLHDEVARLGTMELHPREEEVTYDSLWLLSRLSNIDKHRRLHLTAWWPDIVYWGSDEPSHRRWRWGQPPYEDGRILGRLINDSTHPEPPATLHEEMTPEDPLPRSRGPGHCSTSQGHP